METPENITMISPETENLPAPRQKKQKKLGQAEADASVCIGCLDKYKKNPPSGGAFVIRLRPAFYAG